MLCVYVRVCGCGCGCKFICVCMREYAWLGVCPLSLASRVLVCGVAHGVSLKACCAVQGPHHVRVAQWLMLAILFSLRSPRRE